GRIVPSAPRTSTTHASLRPPPGRRSAETTVPFAVSQIQSTRSRERLFASGSVVLPVAVAIVSSCPRAVTYTAPHRIWYRPLISLSSLSARSPRSRSVHMTSNTVGDAPFLPEDDTYHQLSDDPHETE